MIPNLLINIDVPDLLVGERFYTEAFPCLTPARRFGDHGVELVGFPAPIYLLVKPVGSSPFPDAPAPEARRYTRHWTPIHLDIVVAPDELEAARDRAIAAGASLERDIEQHAWGRIAYFADPFGNGVCILAFTGRGYDAIAT